MVSGWGPVPQATPQRLTGDDPVAAELFAADGEEFAQIYERHLQSIYSYLLAQTGNQHDAEDLSQQVFTQALAAYPRYRSTDYPVTAWLFRIARNLVVDSRRRRRPSLPWEAVPQSHLPCAGDNVEETVLRREAVERLAPFLARLAPAKRELLALRFAGGLKVPEIAEVLERTEQAVRSDLHRILVSLKEAYTDE